MSILHEYDYIFNGKKGTLFHLACWKNHLGIAKMLLEYGADPNAIFDPNGYQMTSMHIAARMKNVSMLSTLIVSYHG